MQLSTNEEIVNKPTELASRHLVTAVIPAYNEEANIAAIVKKVSEYAELVIVVDDGSHDNTADVASAAGARVIKHNRNKGKGIALRSGFSESFGCESNVVVTIDADGQHDPCDIPKLIHPILSGSSDIVVGSRFVTDAINEIPTMRSLGLSLINVTSKLLIKSCVRDNQSGYRAYSKNILKSILQCEGQGYGAETEHLARAEHLGYRIAEIPISIRYEGIPNTSKSNPFLHGFQIMRTIVGIAGKRNPLHLMGIPGIVLVGFALVSLTYLLLLFNETRYFSIPIAIITLGFFLVGILLILMSLLFQELKHIRESQTFR